MEFSFNAKRNCNQGNGISLHKPRGLVTKVPKISVHSQHVFYYILGQKYTEVSQNI